jgi:hypothetical protein
MDDMRDGPFVERVFTLDQLELPCRFFRPTRGSTDFQCRYEIAWQDRTHLREVSGIDAVQALLLAMEGAAADLLTSKEHQERRLSWAGGGGLGLPVTASLEDLDTAKGC